MSAGASSAQTFTWALGRARGQATWRLRRRDRRYRRLVARRAHDRTDLASWAAVRSVLRERGVPLDPA